MTENSMQNNRKNRDPETRSGHGLPFGDPRDVAEVCLLYTSDAADERSSVDLGGRRIIKKKNKETAAGCRKWATR